jgi:hypothetical protein
MSQETFTLTCPAGYAVSSFAILSLLQSCRSIFAQSGRDRFITTFAEKGNPSLDPSPNKVYVDSFVRP